MLEHILDDKTPKEVWDKFAMLFSKKNDTRLQFLENELFSISQRDMTIAQYFHKVKSSCWEITELDPKSTIVESRMKRIIIHGLRPEYRSFIIVVQGWPTQPSLVEFKNLLASQEAMAKQIGGITLKGVKKKHSTQVKVGAIIGRLPNVDTMVTKEEVTKELHNLRELRRTTTRVSKERDLEVFAIIVGKRVTCLEIVGPGKSVESNVAISKKKIEDEWDAEVLCPIVEEELALMAMMEEHIDYEDDWIIASGCLNHMIDDQSCAMEEGCPSEKEVLPGLDNTEEIPPQKTGEQTVHICFSANVPEDSSDTSIGEQEVTQPSEPSENEMTPQQLKRSERIQKPNPKYANITIIEDEVKEPETYVEASQNTA